MLQKSFLNFLHSNHSLRCVAAYFGKTDVLRNVCVDNRYPYHVDFYVKSHDLFIELNGDFVL